MKKITLVLPMFIMLNLLSPLTISSQTMLQWSQLYDGPGHSVDIGKSIANDNFGNIYVTGYSRNSISVGSEDFCTIKYDANGNLLWVQRYDGPGQFVDVASSIKVDISGNIYITGSSFGIEGNYDFCTIKYDSSGHNIWTHRYNGPGNYYDCPSCLSIDGSGNVIVSGGSYGIEGNYDICTIKYSSSGEELWVSRYVGSANGGDFANSIAIDESDNIYVTGYCFNSGTSSDYCTIKYDKSGEQQWAAVYNGPANGTDQALSIALDSFGNIFVTGRSQGNSTDYDCCTIKYDSLGKQQWVKRYNGPGNNYDQGSSIVIDHDEYIIVAGWSWGNNTEDDFCTVKYTQAGAMQWVTRYNSIEGKRTSCSDGANKVTIDNSNNVYVTGVSDNDICTIKYNSGGNIQWVETINGSGNYDEAHDMAVDALGNVSIIGESTNSNNNVDYICLKYSQVVGIKSELNEISSKYQLYQNYPNPFNPSTIVSFLLPKASNVKLAVFDVLGREVAQLISKQLNPGSYEVEWDATNFPSGVYFYRITAGEFTESKKMLLIK